jgi:hypothetical protein
VVGVTIARTMRRYGNGVGGSAVVIVLGIVSLGCGGGAGGGRAPASLDDFIAGELAAICKYNVACGAMPDVPTCLASLQLDTTDFLTIKADVASGKVRYNRDKAEGCLELFDNGFYDSGCKYSTTPSNSSGAICLEVFTGTVSDGGPCFESYECASGTCGPTDKACSPVHQCCAGTCAPKPPPLAIGADCSAPLPGQGCETGAVCITTVSSSPTARCVLPSPVRGTACTSRYECKAPLFCDLTSLTAGTCQPSVATGGACNASSLVFVGACDDFHDYCDKTTHVCTRLGAVGDPCDTSQRNCLGYAQCVGATCVAKSPERGACDATKGLGCLGNLECSSTTSTCAFPDNAGACS